MIGMELAKGGPVAVQPGFIMFSFFLMNWWKVEVNLHPITFYSSIYKPLWRESCEVSCQMHPSWSISDLEHLVMVQQVQLQKILNYYRLLDNCPVVLSVLKRLY